MSKIKIKKIKIYTNIPHLKYYFKLTLCIKNKATRKHIK